MAVTTEQIVVWVAEAVSPLQDRLALGRVEQLLSEIGSPTPDIADQITSETAQIAAAVEGLVAEVAPLANAIRDDDLEEIIRLVRGSTSAMEQLVAAVQQLANKIDDIAGGRDDLKAFAAKLPERVFGYFFSLHLERTNPAAHAAAELLGLIETPVIEDEGSAIPLHIRRTVRFDLLGPLVSDPFDILQALYGWGTSDLGWELFLQRLFRLVAGTGFAFIEEDPDAGPPRLRIPLVDIAPTEDPVPGLRATARADLAAGASLVRSLTENISWEASSAGAIEAAMAIELLPSGDLRIIPPSGTFSGAVHLGLKAEDPTGARTVFLGSVAGTRIEAKSVGVGAGANLTWQTDKAIGEFVVFISVVDGCFVLDLQQADAFLTTLLPSEGLTIDFDFRVNWSRSKGLHIDGSAGLETELPVNQSVGPVSVTSIYLGLHASDEGLSLLTLGSASARLGPVTVSIDRVGAETALSFPTDGRNLGIAHFGVHFRPPTGLGLTIDTGAVVGGGYLFFDHEREEYAGALQVEVGDISLKATGLLTTRMPDGSKGFSLLVIITAEFSPAIQLGFGFNLSGVGGLLGINRTVVVDVLRDGLRARTLDSILFPDDPVGNAPAIISNLRSVFPPAADQYVFGPVASITWGTPKILMIELGVVLELPAPLRLILMGRIKMMLPDERAPLVKINLDILGILDFDAQEISIDAALFDSRLVAYTLTGDMAMRMTYGRKPQFALSIGGLHPSFEAPPRFPVLERVAVSLSAGNNPRIRMEAYLAITSNTAQVGARLDLYASVGKFSVEGTLGFDAMFQFSPFQFVVDIHGSVKLKRGSRNLMAVTVDLGLSGPSPWRAHGKATFKVLFFKGSVSFDKTIGRREEQPVATTDVWVELEAALEAPANWSALLPDEGHMYVTLRERRMPEDGNEKQLLVHPLGALTVRQRVVPLRVEIAKFGNTRPSGANRFEIAEVQVGEGEAETAPPPVKEHFAPAQFIEMSDSEKLSRPSFEEMQAGVRIGAGGALAGEAVPCVVEYDELIVDKKRGGRKKFSFANLAAEALSAAISRSAAAHSHLFDTGNAKYRTTGLGIEVHEKAYVVADTDALHRVTMDTPDAASYTEAAQALNRYTASNRADRIRLQIVELHEVAT